MTPESLPNVLVIGAGLAGSEAAWQLAIRGVPVTLCEMRPGVRGPAHHTGDFAELVCSNSLKSDDPATAAGLLKRELELLGSLILRTARACSVSAGGALAVDRTAFAESITRTLTSHPLVRVDRAEVGSIPSVVPVIVATGPLTSPAMEGPISALVGSDRLAFFDAAAPIVDALSISGDRVFAASRYGKGEGDDYLNCPMSHRQYEAFIDALLAAEQVKPKGFEPRSLFQACQPIEEIARSGRDAPRFGPLKPVGLTDPATGKRPWAVVQLRAENRDKSAFNLVGFQTSLRFDEQRRVFRMIPGLENAEFLRYGVMHRNTFVDAPRVLGPDFALRSRPSVSFAGQLTGTEGYLEAAGTGLLAALNVFAKLTGQAPVVLPETSALGSLVAYATDPETTDYQPMHVNFGLVHPLDPPIRNKKERYEAYARRAVHDVVAYLDRNVWITSSGAKHGEHHDLEGDVPSE